MYTPVMLFALLGSSFASHALPESSLWISDYGEAHRRGLREHKPLAVFLAPGGVNQLSEEGRWGKEVERLLEKHFVCVYVDTSKPSNKALAADFDLSEGKGIVISDHSGNKQAFRHEGRLSERQLERSLVRYADSERSVVTTETATSQSAAPPAPVYVPAMQPAMQPAYPPAGYFPAFQPGPAVSSGRSC
jgi:hypothetical protein